MKKISIILSAALLAATFALAGCSNVTELNGLEWDTYKAGASGKSLKEANDAAAAEAAKMTLTITDAKIKNGKYEAKYATTDTLPNSFTFPLATKATADFAANTDTLTITTNAGSVVYKNAKVSKDGETITFNRASGETLLTTSTSLSASLSLTIK